jgi:hypothetical protein
MCPPSPSPSPLSPFLPGDKFRHTHANARTHTHHDSPTHIRTEGKEKNPDDEEKEEEEGYLHIDTEDAHTETHSPPMLVIEHQPTFVPYYDAKETRFLRVFIVFIIAWSATITSCLGPYFPLYAKEK